MIFDLLQLREYCMAKKGTTETFPFDETTLVFKVANKMYLLTDVNCKPLRMNLKCDPTWANELRGNYDCIMPGFHMNKKHWNTVEMNQQLTLELVKKMIDHSYDLVVKGLSKKERLQLSEP